MAVDKPQLLFWELPHEVRLKFSGHLRMKISKEEVMSMTE